MEEVTNPEEGRKRARPQSPEIDDTGEYNDKKKQPRYENTDSLTEAYHAGEPADPCTFGCLADVKFSPYTGRLYKLEKLVEEATISLSIQLEDIDQKLEIVDDVLDAFGAQLENTNARSSRRTINNDVKALVDAAIKAPVSYEPQQTFTKDQVKALINEKTQNLPTREEFEAMKSELSNVTKSYEHEVASLNRYIDRLNETRQRADEVKHSSTRAASMPTTKTQKSPDVTAVFSNKLLDFDIRLSKQAKGLDDAHAAWDARDKEISQLKDRVAGLETEKKALREELETRTQTTEEKATSTEQARELGKDLDPASRDVVNAKSNCFSSYLTPPADDTEDRLKASDEEIITLIRQPLASQKDWNDKAQVAFEEFKKYTEQRLQSVEGRLKKVDSQGEKSTSTSTSQSTSGEVGYPAWLEKTLTYLREKVDLLLARYSTLTIDVQNQRKRLPDVPDLTARLQAIESNVHDMNEKLQSMETLPASSTMLQIATPDTPPSQGRSEMEQAKAAMNQTCLDRKDGLREDIDELKQGLGGLRQDMDGLLKDADVSSEKYDYLTRQQVLLGQMLQNQRSCWWSMMRAVAQHIPITLPQTLPAVPTQQQRVAVNDQNAPPNSVHPASMPVMQPHPGLVQTAIPASVSNHQGQQGQQTSTKRRASGKSQSRRQAQAMGQAQVLGQPQGLRRPQVVGHQPCARRQSEAEIQARNLQQLQADMHSQALQQWQVHVQPQAYGQHQNYGQQL